MDLYSSKLPRIIINTRKCGNYICIATCSLALHSNSLELAHTFSYSIARSLAHLNSHSTELAPTLALAHACQNFFALAHSRSSTCWLTFSWTCWNSLILPRTRSCSLELTYTCSRLPACWLAVTRTRSPGALETIQFSLTSFMLFLEWIHLLHSYQILRRYDRKAKFKRMPPGGWIQLMGPIFTRAFLPGPS